MSGTSTRTGPNTHTSAQSIKCEWTDRQTDGHVCSRETRLAGASPLLPPSKADPVEPQGWSSAEQSTACARAHGFHRFLPSYCINGRRSFLRPWLQPQPLCLSRPDPRGCTQTSPPRWAGLDRTVRDRPGLVAATPRTSQLAPWPSVHQPCPEFTAVTQRETSQEGERPRLPCVSLCPSLQAVSPPSLTSSSLG